MAARSIHGPSSASQNWNRVVKAAERDFDDMNKVGLRKVAKELGVRQNGVSVAELKVACKRAATAVAKEAGRDCDAMNQGELRKAAKEEHAVWEARQQTPLTAWMAGNAGVGESATAPLDSNSEDNGAGAVLGTARQALPVLCLKAKRRQEHATPLFKAKRRQEHATPVVKAKWRQERDTNGEDVSCAAWGAVA